MCTSGGSPKPSPVVTPPPPPPPPPVEVAKPVPARQRESRKTATQDAQRAAGLVGTNKTQGALAAVEAETTKKNLLGE